MMRLRWKTSGLLGIGVLAIASASLRAGTITGAFSSPLTSDLLLSVDINNGGPAASVNNTGFNQGWSGSANAADPYGVTWQPWGGATARGGTGTALTTGGLGTHSRTFGAITVDISAPGTATNYAAGGWGAANRTGLTGANTSVNAGASNLFSDFLFIGAGTEITQSTNYIKVQFSGLTPDALYQVAMYSYDYNNVHVMNWTATPPTNGTVGWNPGGTFVAPADEQTISWALNGTRQAPAVFTVAANGAGTLAVYGYGGVLPSGAIDTTYINGFQIAAIPEPGSLVLLSIGAIGLVCAAHTRRRIGG